MCQITPTNCPDEFADQRIDWTYPFNFPSQTIDDVYKYNIPDLNYVLKVPICPLFFLITGPLLASGDFDVKITDNNAANQQPALELF